MSNTVEPALTLELLKSVAKDQEFIACVRAYLIARAFAETERIRVDAYIKPLFELYTFTVAPENAGRARAAGERITDINLLYLTDLKGKEYLQFMEECDKEHRKHGFTGKPGYCPALIAESLQIDAENLLLDDGLAKLQLGFDKSVLWGEKRARMLDLLIGLAIRENPGEFTKEKLLDRVMPVGRES